MLFAHKKPFILAHVVCLLSFLRRSFGWWLFAQVTKVFNLLICYKDIARNYFSSLTALYGFTTSKFTMDYKLGFLDVKMTKKK